MRRVGHKGADLIAPGNTLASFDAAVAHGVDMIEFDVLPENVHDRTGSRLVLAHDYTRDVQRAASLDEGLDHLASTAFDGIDLDVDLKLPGYEDRVLEALRARDLLDRTLISSMYPESLERLRAVAPEVRLGWSVPRVKRDYTASVLFRYPAAGALAYGRAILPRRAAQAIRERRCEALMVFHRLITPRAVRAIHDAGGEIYAWTVDDAARIAALEAMGVDGVITNDPRLFEPERVVS
jgi:glycerophosphoryl diester phosphodiesterase